MMSRNNEAGTCDGCRLLLFRPLKEKSKLCDNVTENRGKIRYDEATKEKEVTL